MKYYKASEIRGLLEASQRIQSDDLHRLRCPFDDLIDHDCYGEPNGCPKGSLQKCKQPIRINRRRAHDLQFATVLDFYFTISATNHDGFIEWKDSSLMDLVDHDLLSLSCLRVYEMP
jgi:hypothetical protein